MAKRKDEVGRPTDIAGDLAAERERNRELEEKIRTLESEHGASNPIGESVPVSTPILVLAHSGNEGH